MAKQTLIHRFMLYKGVKPTRSRKTCWTWERSHHGRMPCDTLVYKMLREDILATLLIRKGTRVHWPEEGGEAKCRAASAVVVALRGRGGRRTSVGYSLHNSSFEYEVGKTMQPWPYFAKSFRTCDSGIHFFATRREAWGYVR